MAIALARKYRPRDFASVAVQSHVSTTLKNAIARGRVAHAYLLCGPRGTGKTTLARVLAMALNCERRLADGDAATGATGGEPCGECASCQRIWSGGASLDVVEIDAASNRGVDDARELRERAMYAPTGDDRYKVYIVDEAHMLTREAWNALLKILEEPPPRVVFVFATTDPQKIAQSAAPVLSRLQRFDLKRIGPAEIRERLAHVLDAEGVGYEPDALGMIARAADGGLRDALSLTDQVLSLGAASEVSVERVREALGLVAEEEYLALLDLIAERRAADVFGEVGRLADAGVDFTTFLAGFTDVLRALLAVALGGTPPESSERLREALAARRDLFPVGDLLRMLQVIGELEPRFRRSGQQRLLLELLLVRFALMDRSVELEDVLRALGGGSSGGGGPADRPARGAARGAAPPDAAAGAAAGAAAPAPRGRSASEASSMREEAPEPVPDRPRRESARPIRADAPPPWDGPPPWEGPPPEEEGASGDFRASARSGAVATAPRPQAAPAPAPARRPAPGATRGGAAIPELHQVVERWDAVVDAVRAAGRTLVAPMLHEAEPLSVTHEGALVLQVANETAEAALNTAMPDLVGALHAAFPGIRRVVLRRADAPAAPRERLTTEAVVAERLAVLRRKDPAIAAAIDELDLELLE